MKHAKHEDRKSFRKWGQSNQAVCTLADRAVFKATASKKGAFERPVKRFAGRALRAFILPEQLQTIVEGALRRS